jgi:CMP/dCMP kinase
MTELPGPGAFRHHGDMGNLAVIAIDGPSGVGKSTTAKAVASTLGWQYLDTGGMYRTAALALHRADISLEDRPGLERVLAGLHIQQRGNAFLLDEEDVSAAIRAPEVGRMASAVATDARVREVLVAQQRRIGLSGGWVVDGRDIGTVVFPDACCKVYLTASPEARAERRLHELRARGEDADFQAVLRDQIRRDDQDMNRSVSPLRRAEDAVELDSSDLDLGQVVAWIVALHRTHS